MPTTPERMGAVYDNPKYYEIAFSYRDIPREVMCFEECFARFSGVPVTRILELACGPSPHLEEICRRGYRYLGLDLNPAMLEVGKRKSEEQQLPAAFLRASMVEFRLAEPVEFAFVALGSLYVVDDEELKRHLASVARALRPGGLYLLDWCVQFGTLPTMFPGGEHWEIERDDIVVEATVTSRWLDEKSRVFEEKLVLEVDDADRHVTLQTSDRRLAIDAEEFLRLIAEHSAFEFVGWWNNWDLSAPLSVSDTGARRPIALIRRTVDSTAA